MNDLKEKYKILIMVILLAFASFLTYFFHVVLKTGIIFTHFFYIPIILAALWWKRKGFVVALFFVLLLVLSGFIIKKGAPGLDDLIRSFMFMVISIFVIILSERIAAIEEFFRENEEKSRLIVQSANDSILLTDSSDNIVECNNAAQALFGYSEEELRGKPFSNLLPERYKDTYRYGLDWMVSAKMSKISEKSIQMHGLRKDASEFALELSIASWRTGKGTFYSSIIRDISERKRLEEEIICVNLSLKKADEIKTQFLSVVSHELRTPITPMKSQIQMILAGYFGGVTEKQKSSLEMILRNTLRLDRLIGDVLDISKLEAGVMKFSMGAANLNELVKNAIETMKQKADDKKIKIYLKETMVPDIIMDTDRITQVVINLVNNAIKFTSPGGSINVEISCMDGNAYFQIKDTGIGITKADMLKLFRPFVQADSNGTRKSEGTGLGLAICKGIINSHGGNIWVESEQGKGSTFQFKLPLIYEKNEMKSIVNLFEKL